MSGDVDADDFVASLHLTDPWIAAITAERIVGALDGFTLSLADGWNMDRLTRAIQDKADLSREGPSTGPLRQSNADARAELDKLAKLSRNLLAGIEGLDDRAARDTFWEAFGYFASRDEAPLGSPEEGYFTFSSDDYRQKLIEPLAALVEILDQAVWRVGTSRQAPRWREKEAQWLRVRFAMGLTAVFEQAFGQPARSNNWLAEYGEQHPWPDFYQRIYSALHGTTEGLNLAEVLRRAANMLPAANLFRAVREDAIRGKSPDE